MQLLLVEFGRGFFKLLTDLVDAGFDVSFVAVAVHDDRFLFAHADLTGTAQGIETGGFEVQTQLFGDHLTAGEDGDVLQHGFAAIAKARSLHGDGGEGALQLVDHQRGQGFPFHVFGDDQERFALLHHFFEDRQDFLDVAELFIGDQDVGFFQHRFHLVGIGDHVGGDVAAVELHPFDHFQLGGEPFGFLDGDDAVVAHLFHRFGDQFADFLIVRGDGRHLSDRVFALDRLGDFLDFIDGRVHRLFNSLAQHHRVGAGGHVFQTFADDGLGQHGSGRGSVPGHIVGFGGHFLDQLGAHVFKGIFQFDFLGDGHPVIGDQGGTEFLFQDDVAALGTQGHFHGIGQSIHATQHRTTCIFAELDLLRHVLVPFLM